MSAENPTAHERAGEAVNVKIHGEEQNLYQEPGVALGTVEDEEVGMVEEAIVMLPRRQHLPASMSSIHHKAKRSITSKSDKPKSPLHQRQKFYPTEV